MHPRTEEVMGRLDLSRFDKIDHPVHNKIVEDVRLIVSSKLNRYELSRSINDVRKDNDPRKYDMTDRTTEVVQGILNWSARVAFFQAQQNGKPNPKYRNVLELIKSTADYYRN